MALAQYKGTLSASGFAQSVPAPVDANVVNTSVAAIVYTTLAAAIATAVADGASPTQAHVTAINNAWTTVKGEIDAAVTAAAAAPTSQTGGLVVVVDKVAVTDWGQFDTICRSIKHRAIAGGIFAP